MIFLYEQFLRNHGALIFGKKNTVFILNVSKISSNYLRSNHFGALYNLRRQKKFTKKI